MPSDGFPQLRDVQIAADLAPALMAFVERVRTFVNWREFGRVPWRYSRKSAIRYYRELAPMLLHSRYSFLSESPTQLYMLSRLAARIGKHGATLFRFMCLNASLDEAELSPFLTPSEVDEFVRLHVIVRHAGRVILPVTFVPYRDYYYVAESRYVMDAPDAYGIRPAHLSSQTDDQIRHFRRILGSGRRQRLLEMGCGIGLIALELSNLAAHREGADVARRGLDFAAINRVVRGDSNVRFYESDLFENVSGKFDVVLFSPWQPTETYLDLITSFVQQVPAYLTDDGLVLLWIGSSGNGGDGVLAEIDRVLGLQSMRATYHVVMSYVEDRRRARVGRLGCLAIQHERGPSRTGPGRRVHVKKNGHHWAWLLRKRYAALAFGRRPSRYG
jgi:SAM-dependent methyltransferase